jgi:hypothetical protein
VEGAYTLLDAPAAPAPLELERAIPIEADEGEAR